MEQKNNEKLLSFEWHSLLRDFLANVWIVILCGIMSLMLVYITSRSLYTPSYTSSATLIANVKTGSTQTYTNLSASSEMANIFSEVFVQPAMKEHAAAYLGQAGFSGTISASVLPSTNIFTVSVTASDPETAYFQLCAILEVYPDIAMSIFSDAVIDIMRPPMVPKAPSNSLPAQNKIQIVGICVLLSAAAVVMISLLRDTVKSEADFRKKIDAKLIGTVAHERKSISLRHLLKNQKIALLINRAGASFRFTENYQHLAAKLGYMQRTAGDKVFLVTSVAENEGKSTTAANIAIALASRGYRVALLDMDFKKPAVQKILSLNPIPGRDFAALLSRAIAPGDFKLIRYKHSSLYCALNAGHHNDYVDWIGSPLVKSVINVFTREFDFVIIDTPPLSVAADVASVAKLADQCMLVVRTDCVYAADINDAILTFTENGSKFAGCILNDVYTEFSLFGQLGYDETGYYTRNYKTYDAYSHYSKYGKYAVIGDLFEDDLSDVTGKTEEPK